MDDATWLKSRDPQPMIEYLWGKASDRKVRLFKCACCRQVWPELNDERSRNAVEVAERFADQQSSVDELNRAGIAAAAVFSKWTIGDRTTIAAAAAETTGRHNSFRGPHCQIPVAYTVLQYIDGAPLVRDIFCNPFRPITLDPAWLTWNHATVPAIARRIYDEGTFHDLPILADALEDAGCTDPDILGHCRQGGQHVRGCWVVDLILGKT